MAGRLQDKAAIVTGGASGFGAGMWQQLRVALRARAQAIMGAGLMVRWWPWWSTRWTSAWSWKSGFNLQMVAETLSTARAHAEEVTVGFRAISQIFRQSHLESESLIYVL